MSSKDLEKASRQRNGRRITPRTCLWPLSLSLVATFGLSIGLTFRSNHHCYAGTCGEWLFPLQARVHVVVWYLWLSLATTFLAVQSFRPGLQRILARHVFEYELPFLKKRLSRGGLLMIFWVLCLYGTLIGVWWPRLHQYFDRRNESAGITKGSGRLAAIALTGHICDVTMGIVLLPISRHSALVSFFQIGVSTALTIHILAAYTLFTVVIIHGLLYLSWIPVFNSLSIDLRKIIPVLNPTYLYRETWPGNQSSLGIWRASLIFTGCLAAIIMLALFVTALPSIRTRHFNLFYFTHLFSFVMVVIICLHASTMFYCTAPGLAMWVLDWGMRLYELRKPVSGNIADLGRGWYCVTMPLPRIRLKGCACRSPLAHFFIHHADSSIRELHPFTTVTHLAAKDSTADPSDPNFPIQFLFRARQRPRPSPDSASEESVTTKSLSLRYYHRRLLHSLTNQFKRKQSVPWTVRLASLTEKKEGNDDQVAVENCSQAASVGVDVFLRLEGPYFTPIDPYSYDTTICLVAGTGISGALAIGTAFNEHMSSSSKAAGEMPTQPRRWTQCCIIWSVKADEEIELPFLEPMAKGLEMRKFLTGRKGRRRSGDDNGTEKPENGRVDLEKEVSNLVSQNDSVVGSQGGGVGGTWVYISGPKPFVTSAKTACRKVQTAGARLDFYAASWDP